MEKDEGVVVYGQELVHKGKYLSYYHYLFENRKSKTKGVLIPCKSETNSAGKSSDATFLTRSSDARSSLSRPRRRRAPDP